MMYRHKKRRPRVAYLQNEKRNKRYFNMSETYPRKNLCETHFAGDTPPSVGFERKGSEKFAIVQIFQLKVYGLKAMSDE